jgi:tight adherence protein C
MRRHPLHLLHSSSTVRHVSVLQVCLLLVALCFVAGVRTADAAGGEQMVRLAEGPSQAVHEVEAPLAPAVTLEAYLAALLGAGGVLFVTMGVRINVARTRLEGRMASFAPTAPGVRRAASAGPSFLRRTLMPLAPLVVWLAQVADSLLPERQMERIRVNLAVAGLGNSRYVAQFLAAKTGLALLLGGLGALYQLRGGAPMLMTLLYVFAGAALGFYLPGIWLARRMSGRRQGVVKAMPDALDLLTISVGAGLGFDGAMVEVIQRWKNPLTEEFSAVLRDLKLGKSRRDALREFAARTGSEEVSLFAAAVVQADELGTPMKDVFQIQAEQMRIQRRQKAEELARKAVIKMIIPMVFFIFPAMFVVILAPALPSLQALTSIARR